MAEPIRQIVRENRKIVDFSRVAFFRPSGVVKVLGGQLAKKSQFDSKKSIREVFDLNEA